MQCPRLLKQSSCITEITITGIMELILVKESFFTFDNFQIISTTDNSLDLLVCDSLLVQQDRPDLNFQQSSIPLFLFWLLLFTSPLFSGSCSSISLVVSFFLASLTKPLSMFFHAPFSSPEN